jgi:hypothetical protein
VDHESEYDEIKTREAALIYKIERLEVAIQGRDEEIQFLQSILGERAVANRSDPATRLIYLEEHSRNLERVCSFHKWDSHRRCSRNDQSSPRHRNRKSNVMEMEISPRLNYTRH